MFCVASIQLCPIADYDMLTVGRSARDLLRIEDRTLAARSKKKEVAPVAMAGGTGKPTYAVQGWQLS